MIIDGLVLDIYASVPSFNKKSLKGMCQYSFVPTGVWFEWQEIEKEGICNRRGSLAQTGPERNSATTSLK